MQPDGSLDAPAAAHGREARARVQPKLTNRHDRAFGPPKKKIYRQDFPTYMFENTFSFFFLFLLIFFCI
jgi:aromatic ring-cleaving dioxygenase